MRAAAPSRAACPSRAGSALAHWAGGPQHTQPVRIQALRPQARARREPAALAAEVASLAALAGALAPPAALAAEALSYNPEGGAEVLKTAAGVGYVGLVIFYFSRLFSKRAKTFTSERLSTSSSSQAGSIADEDSDDEDVAAAPPAPPQPVTALQCFIGASQAGACAYILFLLAQGVDSFFAGQPMPDAATSYTAHNVTVLVQTVARGLVYLATFIFAANALGLSALTVKALISPESLNDDGPARPATRASDLPDVSVTDDIFAVRRAFEAAERAAKQQQPRDGGGSS